MADKAKPDMAGKAKPDGVSLHPVVKEIDLALTLLKNARALDQHEKAKAVAVLQGVRGVVTGLCLQKAASECEEYIMCT